MTLFDPKGITQAEARAAAEKCAMTTDEIRPDAQEKFEHTGDGYGEGNPKPYRELGMDADRRRMDAAQS